LDTKFELSANIKVSISDVEGGLARGKEKEKKKEKYYSCCAS